MAEEITYDDLATYVIGAWSRAMMAHTVPTPLTWINIKAKALRELGGFRTIRATQIEKINDCLVPYGLVLARGKNDMFVVLKR